MIRSTEPRLTVFLIVALYARASAALPPSVYHQVDHDYDEPAQHHRHHVPPPATSYATISTTHVKVQHPPASPAKYSTPYKYEYLMRPQMTYKYVSLPSAVVLQQQSGGGKYEEPSTPGYKYLAASPTYKYVQPPAVTTEPEAAEEPTNTLKYAFKYEQNAFKQQQQQQRELYEQPVVRYKYVAVPSYEYAQHQQQLAGGASYDYTDDGDDDDKQQQQQ